MHFLPALTAAAFLLPATAMNQAIAQPIYRCGNSYSQEACKGGKVVEDKTTTLHSGQRVKALDSMGRTGSQYYDVD
ncbi:hypothetical protein [Comamonas thiooxydans]|uniref:hypothetical protein n=1 Tax=Comamonas thiooxydans TaxID=363952 RepID=UPI00209C4B12|nr:hypothetical protein [Comamonas thiooxydans]